MGRASRIVIIDNEPLPRSAFRLLIDAAPELTVVGECDMANAPDRIKQLHPDVALLHAASPTAAALATIRTIAPAAPVGVLTRQRHRAYVRSCLAAGARAYMLTTGAPNDLFTALRLVAHGHRYMDASLHDTLLDIVASSGHERAQVLSGRECQVLTRLAYGFTNQQIAGALSISRRSVDTYRQRISTKLGLKNRSEIVRYALATGLLSPEGLELDVHSHHIQR